MPVEGGEEGGERREERKEGKAIKVVSIRGVDEEVYGKLVSVARDLGKTVGEVVNEAFRLFISTINEASRSIERAVSGTREIKEAIEEGIRSRGAVVIRDIGELSVTEDDLKTLGKKVIFKNVKRLKFSEDVDSETFNDFVYSILLCDELVVPKTLPKLMVLSKCRFVKSFKWT